MLLGWDTAASGPSPMTTDTIEGLQERVNAGDRAAMRLLAEQLDTQARHYEALKLLARAAHRGDPIAKGRIGARLLLGDRAPRRTADGLRLIEDAAAEGSGDAAALAATLAGLGAFRPQDWTEALDRLVQAAELGHASARRQLAVLATGSGGAVDTPGPDAWQGFRERIDVAALIAPPEGRVLCPAPLIKAFADFASSAACAWLIERARRRLTHARVYNPVSQQQETNETRTNTTATFDLLEADLVQILLQARMAAAAGVPFAHLESLAVLHYDVGEQITPHYDFVDPDAPDYERQIARDGQRVVTFLVYLNDDYEGGETRFPRLGVSHRGVAGEGLFFTNAQPSGASDLRSIHAGCPPTSGEKWIVSQFARNRPFIPGVAPTERFEEAQ